jgi:hypothetical protein
MIKQLDAPFDVVTPLGVAVCMFVAESGQDQIEWGCFQVETGECWWWPNQQIRLRPNISANRPAVSEIALSDEAKGFLAPHLARHKKAPQSIPSPTSPRDYFEKFKTHRAGDVTWQA